MPSSSGRGFQPNSLIALLGSGFQPLMRNAICTVEANGLILKILAIASSRRMPIMMSHSGMVIGT